MLKRSFFLIFFVIVSQSFLVNSAQVDIISELYEDKTLFTYKFSFTENESYKSFSIEKPRSSTINYILDSESLSYSIAGDYFIFKPKDLDKKFFEVSFISEEISKNVAESNSYLTYQNFNFDVEILTYTLILRNNFSNIEDVSPRNYEIDENGNYYWEIENPPKDLLVLMNFEGSTISIPNTSNDLNKLLLLFIIPIFLFFILIFFIKKHNTKEEKKISKKKTKLKTKNKKIIKKPQKKETSQEEKIDNKKFEEIKEKYLTDNEKEVLEIIKKEQGILQNDILNHLPQLTKSNLSKIISKLHSRKILSRIRVGKVNKIYLGERLEKKEELSESLKE